MNEIDDTLIMITITNTITQLYGYRNNIKNNVNDINNNNNRNTDYKNETSSYP